MNFMQEPRTMFKETQEYRHTHLLGLRFLDDKAGIIKQILSYLDSPIIILGRRDGKVYALTSDLRTILGEATIHGSGGVWCMAINDLHNLIACGSGHGRIEIFSHYMRKSSRLRLPCSEGMYVSSLSFIHKGTLLCAGTEIGFVHVIDVPSMIVLKRVCEGNLIHAMIEIFRPGQILSEALCAHGCSLSRFTLTPQTEHVYYMSTTTLAYVPIVGATIYCLLADTSKDIVYCGCESGEVAIYNTWLNAVVASISIGLNESVWTLSYLNNGDILLVGVQSGYLHNVEVPTLTRNSPAEHAYLHEVPTLTRNSPAEHAYLHVNEAIFAKTAGICIFDEPSIDGSAVFRPATVNIHRTISRTTFNCAIFQKYLGTYTGDNYGRVILQTPEGKIHYAPTLEALHIPWNCCSYMHEGNQECNNAVCEEQLNDVWCIGIFHPM